jgi:hypothetical protein
VVLAFFAAIAGWWLLRPIRHAHRPPITAAVPTLVPTPVPATTAPEQASATPIASPLQTPAPSPSAVMSQNPNGPQLALIIDDCGQWLQTERGFIALGIPLTLSVLPHVTYSGEIASEAAQGGKGVMLHLPMETLSGLNPGPGKVTTEMTDPQIVAQVEDDLAQVPLARGVNNHEGSKASADPRVMHDVLGVLSQRGLFFIDSRTNPASVGEATARALGVPTAARDVFLDNKADVAYSEGQLLEAAAVARRTGQAIAIGHPRPTTLAAVEALIPRLQTMGIRFVLAQDLVTGDAR